MTTIREALRELVELKDLKDRIEQWTRNETTGEQWPSMPRAEREAACADYDQRKPIAWANARAALAEPVVSAPEPVQLTADDVERMGALRPPHKFWKAVVDEWRDRALRAQKELAAERAAVPAAGVALTDEQIDALDTFALHVMAPRGRNSVREFARAVLAASAPVEPAGDAQKAAAFVQWFDLYGVSIEQSIDPRGSLRLYWYRGETFGNTLRELITNVETAIDAARAAEIAAERQP